MTNKENIDTLREINIFMAKQIKASEIQPLLQARIEAIRSVDEAIKHIRTIMLIDQSEWVE